MSITKRCSTSISWNKKCMYSQNHFSEDDLLFGDTFHNRPLFTVSFAHDKRVNRILVDERCTINILLIRIMKELGILTIDFINSCLMIQGFNQGEPSNRPHHRRVTIKRVVTCSSCKDFI